MFQKVMKTSLHNQTSQDSGKKLSKDKVDPLSNTPSVKNNFQEFMHGLQIKSLQFKDVKDSTNTG